MLLFLYSLAPFLGEGRVRGSCSVKRVGPRLGQELCVAAPAESVVGGVVGVFSGSEEGPSS